MDNQQRATCALLSLFSFLQISTSNPQIVLNNNVHSVNSVGNGLKDATLDKIKLIRHIPSGKCMIIENRDVPVGKFGGRVVLWECHDVKQ